MAKSGFRGGPLGGGGGGMSQANQIKKMQEQMMRAQEELETKTFSASSGGGAVTATVTGARELSELKIEPDALVPEDAEIIQDMIIAAVNEALRAADKAASDNMSRFTGGLNLGAFGL